MKLLLAAIRVLAVLPGIFLCASAVLDILGLVPHSDAMPPVTRRIAHNLPSLGTGLILVIPYRGVRSAAGRGVVGNMLCAIVTWVLLMAAQGVYGYAAGQKNWQVIPLAAILLLLAGANLRDFARITRGRTAAGLAIPPIRAS